MDKWKLISKMVRARDGMHCRICGRRVYGKDAHVHHIIPKSQGGTDSLDNLILVCPRCHSRIHGRYLNVRNKKLIPIDEFI